MIRLPSDREAPMSEDSASDDYVKILLRALLLASEDSDLNPEIYIRLATTQIENERK